MEDERLARTHIKLLSQHACPEWIEERELAPQWNTVFVKDDDNPEIAMTGQSDVIAILPLPRTDQAR